jgi:hypothetical protein
MCTDAGSLRSFTAIRKEAGLFCGYFLRKGEVFAYVGSIKNLKNVKGMSLEEAHSSIFCHIKHLARSFSFHAREQNVVPRF